MRFAWLAIGCLRLRHLRLSETPLDPTPEILIGLENELGVRVRWFSSNGLTRAATYGLWRPAVLSPQRNLAGPAPTLELIARHELLHVRRHDWFFVVVEECLQAALWFEPAVWLLIDRITLHREQAVDAAVVQKTRQSEIYTRALIAGAGLAHIEGLVKLAIIIEADGSVSDVRITESLDPTFGLDDEAVKAARQWSFNPARKDGKPVAIGVELELRFLLK
jgi:TonB family protein